MVSWFYKESKKSFQLNLFFKCFINFNLTWSDGSTSQVLNLATWMPFVRSVGATVLLC
jgi:hypothetical protein